MNDQNKDIAIVEKKTEIIEAQPPGKEITNYMQNPVIVQKFSEIMGEQDAKMYIASVLVQVVSNDKLKACTKESIYTSSLRAATLRLSVDPAKRQAYLVPIQGKCEFWPGAKGLYDMSMRTGNYSWINYDKLFEGEEAVIDKISGVGSIVGQAVSKKVIGYFAAFKLIDELGGMEKMIFMDMEDITAHKEKYAKGWQRATSAWQTNLHDMGKKTVLIQIVKRYAIMDKTTNALLTQIDRGNEKLHEPDIDLVNIEAPQIETGETIIEDEGETEQTLEETTTPAMPRLEYTEDDRPKAKDDWKSLHDWARKYFSAEDVTHRANLAGDAQVAFDNIVAELEEEEQREMEIEAQRT